MSRRSFILLFWFFLLAVLASREGEWWEDRLAKQLKRGQPHLKITKKPPRFIETSPVVELPHPSRELTQVPVFQEYDNFLCATAAVVWDSFPINGDYTDTLYVSPKNFVFNENPFDFPEDIHWVIENIEDTHYLIIELPWDEEKIEEVTEGKTTVSFEFK